MERVVWDVKREFFRAGRTPLWFLFAISGVGIGFGLEKCLFFLVWDAGGCRAPVSCCVLVVLGMVVLSDVCDIFFYLFWFSSSLSCQERRSDEAEVL